MADTTADPACPDCRALIGDPHEEGCDVARCLATGGQRLQCDGQDEEYPYGDHDCGADTWTGRWPGEAEAEEFGWFVQDRCAEGLGWTPCAPDAPGARPDLNRIATDAVWNPTTHRWDLRPDSSTIN